MNSDNNGNNNKTVQHHIIRISNHIEKQYNIIKNNIKRLIIRPNVQNPENVSIEKRRDI